MKFLATLIITVFTLSANAQATEEEFYDQVKALVEAKVEPVDVELEKLSAKEKVKLLEAAQYQADIWYDTILESDYTLDSAGKLSVATVQKYFGNNNFVAYRITYSHPAYSISYCETEWEGDYDDEAAYKKYLAENCTRGRITGASYVSPNFEFQLRDDDAIEDFED